MLLSRRQLLAGSAACGLLLNRDAKAWTHGSLPGSGTTTWKPLVFGAGGYVTGLSVANDGTIYTRADVQPGWRLDHGATKHVPLFNANNLLSIRTAGDQLATGIWDVCTAPTNSSIVYAIPPITATGGAITLYVYKSTDKGSTWALTGFPSIPGTTVGDTNGNRKFVCQRSAVDPANVNHVLIWYPSNLGLHRTLDGGSTYDVVAGGLPVGQTGTFPGGSALVFDPTYSPATTTLPGGQVVTSRILTNVWGGGQWESTDGGQTWSNISASIAATTVSQTTAHANSIFVVHIQVFAGTVTSISDSVGLTWTKRAGPIFNAASNCNLYEYSATAAVAQAYTITVNASNGSTTVRVAASAWTGVSGFDAGLPATSATAAPTGSTSGTNRIVVAYTKNFATGLDSGYSTLNSDTPSKSFFSEYQVFAATQTNINPGGTGSVAVAGILDALVETGSGTGALDVAASGVVETTSAGGPVNLCSGSINPWTTGSYLTKRWWGGEKNIDINSGRTKTWRYNDDGTWTEILASGSVSFEAWATCPDPSTPGRVWIVGNAVATAISTLDNGATNPLPLGKWSGNINTPAASGGNQWTFNNYDVGWQAITVNVGGTQVAPIEFPGDAFFDPITANKMWMTTGTGLRYYNPPSTYVAYQTNILSLGMEMLVPTNGGFSIPGGTSFCGVEDRGFMPVINPNSPPANYILDGNVGVFDLTGGYGGDYASNNTSFVVVAITQQGAHVGTSTDGGSTWTLRTKAMNPDTYPALACADVNNWVMTCLDANAWIAGIGPGGTNLTTGVPIYTTDGTVYNTCQHSSGDGGGNLPTNNWSHGGNRGLWTDRTTIGTYWMRNFNSGLYKSTDSGATWTLLTTTGLSFKRAQDATGKGLASPYDYSQQAGWTSDLWYSALNSNDTLWHSTDGGLTWTSISLVTSVIDWSFGAPQTPGGFPTLFIWGSANGVFGANMSVDYGVTWIPMPDLTQYGNRIIGETSFGQAIVGDGVTFGRCYFGYWTAWAWGQYNP